MLTVAKLCLFACVLSLGQGENRAQLLPTPQLITGQELVYSGTYQEQEQAAGVQFQKEYRLESRVFVLETQTAGWNIAALTCLSLRRSPAPAGAEKDNAAAAASVRLEMAQLDRRGAISSADKVDLAVPLAGPPTVELGCFVTLPRVPVGPNHYWEVAEAGRPPSRWRIVGTEIISSTHCLKLEGKQQSDDWDRPRADSVAWRRTDLVWLAPQTGLAYKVERIIERRAPARLQPTQRLVARYELDSQLAYPGRLFEDRRQEIQHASKFNAEADILLPEPGEKKHQIDLLAQRVRQYLQERPPTTPYRQAIEQLQHRIEAVRRGDVVAAARVTTPLIHVARRGHRVPDFLVTDLIHQRTVRLYRLLGRPILIVFYNPATENGLRVLEFARTISEKFAEQVTVLGMAVTEDVPLVRRQQQEMRLAFPLLDGRGLHTTFHVDATPRMILLDADGMMRGGFTGWGFHIPGEVLSELQRCLPPPGRHP